MTKIDVLTELREQQRVRPRSYSSDLAQRAADEIERLRKWNADMVAKAASGGTLDGYREMGARLAALEAERDRLREALRPFCDALSRYVMQDHVLICLVHEKGSEKRRLNVLLGEAFNRARAALEGGGDG